MKKTIIANFGGGTQGKSGTIKKIIKLILNKYPNALTNPPKISYHGDVKVIIEIDNIKIGIESQGDPNSRIFKSLKEFASINCDLIICATRTSGATVNAVYSLRKSHDYDIIWVTNYRSANKDTELLNELSANHILELVEKLIKNTI